MIDRENVRRRYDRIAPVFDVLEALLEGLSLRNWRRQLWREVKSGHVLEVGVGTGKNFSFYPEGVLMTAIDFSPGMLAQARRKQQRSGIRVTLAEMDVEGLQLGSHCFDSVVGTFVFCSVPAPRQGLREIYRVLRPGGELLLLEHVISTHPLLAKLMRLLDPLVSRMFGAHINRDTVKNVQASGFRHVKVTHLNHFVKLVRAIK